MVSARERESPVRTPHDEGRDVLTCWFLEKLSVNFYAGSMWRRKKALGGRRSQSYPQGIPRSCGLAARDRTHDIQHSPRRTMVSDAMTRGDEDWRGVGNQGCGTFAWQALTREFSGFRPHRAQAEPSDMNRTGVLTVTEREASPKRVNPSPQRETPQPVGDGRVSPTIAW